MRQGLAAVLTAVVAVCAAGPVWAQGIEFGPSPDRPDRPAKKPPAIQHVVPTTAPAAPAPVANKPLAPSSPVETPDVPPANAAAPPPVGPRKVVTSGLPPAPKPRDCKNSGNFPGWLANFKKQAAANGISSRTIQLALGGMTLDGSVIGRDRKQGFFAQSFIDFYSKLASQARVQSGRAQIKKNEATFDRVEKEYGVPASVITGFWALESDFGKGMGELPIMRSLATLAYDCRRGEMFEMELMAALQIIDRGDMTPDTMVGSWAGEIGQTQFLPTRYLEHAIDYDGDGQSNLFSNSTDIIGSTANYMKHLGWRSGEPWLEQVRLTGELPWDKADLAIKLPRSQWAQWGVTRLDGGAVESDQMPASLMLPMGRFGPAFLVYENFNVYLQWNQSLTYALTAAHLATRIDGAPTVSRPKRDIPVLSQDEAKDLQRMLVKRGFEVGEIDGKIGASSRAAIKATQVKLGLPADSYPTPELLAAMRGSS